MSFRKRKRRRISIRRKKIGSKRKRFLSVKLRKGKRRRRYRIARGGAMLG